MDDAAFDFADHFRDKFQKLFPIFLFFLLFLLSVSRKATNLEKINFNHYGIKRATKFLVWQDCRRRRAKVGAFYT